MGGCCSAPDKALSIQEEQELVAKNPASSTSDAFGLSNYFESQRLLGEGGSGETWLMKDKTTKELVAVKMIKRPIPKALHQMLLQEIMIQRDLGEGHINIVTSREVMLTPSHMAIVMEYVSGGTLTKYVSDRWKTVGDRGGLFLTEEEARYFFKVRQNLERPKGRFLAISFGRGVLSSAQRCSSRFEAGQYVAG